jgi:hypothetical protein
LCRIRCFQWAASRGTVAARSASSDQGAESALNAFVERCRAEFRSRSIHAPAFGKQVQGQGDTEEGRKVRWTDKNLKMAKNFVIPGLMAQMRQ